jgi:hypothetical protein
MRPIDFCTPKPLLMYRVLVVFPAQRSGPSCGLAAASGDRSRAEPRGSCPSARRLFRAPRHTSGDAQRGHRRARGRPMRDEAGEDRVSRRDPHFGDRPSRHAGVVLPRASSMAITSDTLSPPPRRGGGSPSGECRAVTRRPPRSVPREPRERRALPRSRVPSAGIDRAHPARAEARTKPRDLPRSAALT